MQCTKCQVNLKRRRVTRGQKTVERENICPECSKHYFTIEFFQDDYNLMIKELEKKNLLSKLESNQWKEKYIALTDALRIIVQAVKNIKS